jgi:hypothetical protein
LSAPLIDVENARQDCGGEAKLRVEHAEDRLAHGLRRARWRAGLLRNGRREREPERADVAHEAGAVRAVHLRGHSFERDEPLLAEGRLELRWRNENGPECLSALHASQEHAAHDDSSDASHAILPNSRHAPRDAGHLNPADCCLWW